MEGVILKELSQGEKNSISQLLYVKSNEQKQNKTKNKENELIDIENRLVDPRDVG